MPQTLEKAAGRSLRPAGLLAGRLLWHIAWSGFMLGVATFGVWSASYELVPAGGPGIDSVYKFTIYGIAIHALSRESRVQASLALVYFRLLWSPDWEPTRGFD